MPRLSVQLSLRVSGSMTLDWGDPSDEDATMMILGPISYLDWAVFLAVLAPQLLWYVGLVGMIECVFRVLPFLLRLPFALVHERFILDRESRTPWVRRATGFEDLCIRCVRYSFANIPARVGRVFFSRDVALPFFYFRLLRHGYLGCPIHWREYRDRYFRGVWMIKDPQAKPDFVLFYVHGGGFVAGSTYFYLEFLLSWLSALGAAGYANPAVFGLGYTLVPGACFPAQVHEAVRAYEHVLAVAGDPANVCVAGDSAGANLVLSMLLHISSGSSKGSNGSSMANRGVAEAGRGANAGLPRPAMALLISPWVTINSPRHKSTPNDFLDVERLNRFGMQYAGDGDEENKAGKGGNSSSSKRSGSYEGIITTINNGIPATSAGFDRGDPLVSPGKCGDLGWWRRASPQKGFCLVYGTEEVFAGEIEELAQTLRRAEVAVEARAEDGMVHVWPLVSLLLASGMRERLRGIGMLTEMIIERMPPPADSKGRNGKKGENGLAAVVAGLDGRNGEGFGDGKTCVSGVSD